MPRESMPLRTSTRGNMARAECALSPGSPLPMPRVEKSRPRVAGEVVKWFRV